MNKFIDRDGDTFEVSKCNECLIRMSVNDHVNIVIYKEDIPLIIELLEAAYSHK